MNEKNYALNFTEKSLLIELPLYQDDTLDASPLIKVDSASLTYSSRYVGPNKVRLELSLADGSAQKFAERFINQGSKGYFYDLDSDPFNQKNQGIMDSKITAEQVKACLANVGRDVKKPGNVDIDSLLKGEGRLTEKQMGLVAELNLTQKIWQGKKSVDTSLIIPRLKRELDKLVQAPEVHVWDTDADLLTAYDQVWMGAANYSALEAKLKAFLSQKSKVVVPGGESQTKSIDGIIPPTAKDKPNYGLPRITQGALAHPTRYLVFLILKDKKTGRVFHQSDETNPDGSKINFRAEDANFISYDQEKYTLPTAKEIQAHIKRITKTPLIFKDTLADPVQRYDVKREYVQVARVGESDIPLLVIPRVVTKCDLNVQTKTLGYRTLEIAIPADQVDGFMSIARVASDQICVEGDEKGGFILRLIIDPKTVDDLIKAIDVVIEASEAGGDLPQDDVLANDVADFFQGDDLELIKQFREILSRPDAWDESKDVLPTDGMNIQNGVTIFFGLSLALNMVLGLVQLVSFIRRYRAMHAGANVEANRNNTPEPTAPRRLTQYAGWDRVLATELNHRAVIEVLSRINPALREVFTELVTGQGNITTYGDFMRLVPDDIRKAVYTPYRRRGLALQTHLERIFYEVLEAHALANNRIQLSRAQRFRGRFSGGHPRFNSAESRSFANECRRQADAGAGADTPSQPANDGRDRPEGTEGRPRGRGR